MKKYVKKGKRKEIRGMRYIIMRYEVRGKKYEVRVMR